MATKGSTRRGMRFPVSEGDDKFLPFFDVVQSAASKLGKVFFLDSGQCREFENEEMSGEDLSGWLIDESSTGEFEPEWKIGWDAIEDKFFDDFVWARWSIRNGSLAIDFERM